jgi:2-C-methyl-D-erythritol 2,4-cyclodiphosphate synthase
VALLIYSKGYNIGNIDATIIAQKPKMTPYIIEMRKNIANVLNISIDQVNIKATTEEGLGFTGKGEGISAQSICLLE